MDPSAGGPQTRAPKRFAEIMRAHARVLPLESLRAARVGTQYHSVSKLEFICAIHTYYITGYRDYR